MFAHRASWLLFVGPINYNLHVLHSCDNTKCANFNNLFLGTHTENMRDKVSKGRAFLSEETRAKRLAKASIGIKEAIKRRKELGLFPKPKEKPTHCIHGHEYTKDNTSVSKDGGLKCKKCKSLSDKRYKMKLKDRLYKSEGKLPEGDISLG